ncbi:MAG TPA: rhomboid family intramembrane serine protease [Methylophilaceae bacterium]|nr:rhomboid family intramembrane serine protease [Methylophilaceae bacterium]HAJ72236.1 rhomboid family intramembrane serine protease [Methylophilaceae bacterium]
MQSLYNQLEAREPNVPITYLLISINVLVFVAMLVGGAGFWHSPNGIQLQWGANFGPATQDGEWWRLGTAMFLHFGIVHLLLNSISLWDVGQLVERMYGRWRYISIYLASGLFGNVLSLVVQGNDAVSGGASGAIFGVYGAVLVFLWRERAAITAREFRWLFGGGLVFAIITIVLGFIIPGIDNAAHIGGFLAGVLASISTAKSMKAKKMPAHYAISSALILCIASTWLVLHIPKPKYKWSEELMLRSAIQHFITEDQEINRNWLAINYESKQGNQSFEELASKIDDTINQPYQESYEMLLKLPKDPALPSSQQLESLLLYTEQRKHQSEALVSGLRKQQMQVNGAKQK